MRKSRKSTIFVASFALLVMACGSSGKSSSTPTTTGTKLSGSATVLAAASLTNAFRGLGKEFETANPGTKLDFSFGASSELETQIEQGAPADVFASADQANMDKVVEANLNAGDPVNFAKNRLVIVTEKGNPKNIRTPADLAKPGTVVVLCDSTVPCGKFADQVLANAKVTVTPKSREANVKATLSKVELGEADAAIVYVSDAKSSDKVDAVQIPDAVNVITTLPIVALKGAKNAPVAQAWSDFVVAHENELVETYGFLPL
jgi:molybdate transport system substrate-binding protein